MEKILRPMSGFLALILAIIFFGLAVLCFVLSAERQWVLLLAIPFVIIAVFLAKGLMIVVPNDAGVCMFFGRYVGTVKDNGMMWVNPLYSTQKISLRAQNQNGQTLKVNDKMGNPVEIAAVIVWQVNNTYKSLFEVVNYRQYVDIQSEAAVRHLASVCPYDNLEDAGAEITLREGGAKVNQLLEAELNERLAPAGIIIREARISHLAYAQEIAGAMLQRQQATAIVAARFKIVEGAVGMVEAALDQLSKRHIVDLDDERKATMVSNLMVVLCGERGAQPVLNTGSLYQ